MKRKISLIIKFIAILSSVYGMLQSLDHWMFFTYFTNLSNIFIDLCLLIFLIYDLKKTKYISQGMYLIKFMGTISITLTFFVYLLLLAPTNSHGFIGAYLNNGAGSLCVHFITPVLAIIDFIFFSEKYLPEKRHVFYSVIPPLVYVGYVIILGQVFRVRWYGDMLAPYNFLNYGASTGWFGFDLSLLGSKTLNQENKERFLLIKDIYLKNCNNLGIDHLLQFFCYDSQALMNYFYNMKMN